MYATHIRALREALLCCSKRLGLFKNTKETKSLLKKIDFLSSSCSFPFGFIKFLFVCE